MERPCKLHAFNEITSQITASTFTHFITLNKPQEQTERAYNSTYLYIIKFLQTIS